SKAAERSRRMRATVLPLSTLVLMSVQAMRVVSGLWFLRNPDWEALNMLFSSKKPQIHHLTPTHTPREIGCGQLPLCTAKG
ncbi:hypothetical protein NDU88_006486, partial [Pleurodeles waltl]